jgi:hypothetical protein
LSQQVLAYFSHRQEWPLSLMRFLSLWLYLKAAAMPRTGKGPGAVGITWASVTDGEFGSEVGSLRKTD